MIEYSLLLPSVIATTFFLPSGKNITRIMAIGLLTKTLVSRPAVLLLFAAMAVLMGLQSIQTTAFQKFDFVIMLGIFQTFIACATLCQGNYVDSSKKPLVGGYMASRALLAATFTSALAYLSIFLAGVHAALFATVAQPVAMVLFELLVQQHQERYDTEQYVGGFGLTQGTAVQHGGSYFANARKNWRRGMAVYSFVSSLIIGQLMNWFGGYYAGPLGYIFLACITVVAILLGAVSVVSIRGGTTPLRQIGIKPTQEEVNVEGEGLVNGEEGQDKQVLTVGQSMKHMAQPLYHVDRRELVWMLAVAVVFYATNLTYYGLGQHIFYYVTLPAYAYLAVKAILHENPITMAVMLIAQPLLLINQQLPAFLALFLLTVLNYQEGKHYATILIYTAQAACLCFSNYEQKWIFSIASSALCLPTLSHVLERNKIGVRIQIFLQTFNLDMLISLPRTAVKNCAVDCMVLVAIVNYGKRYMETAVGRDVSTENTLSIVIRLAVNLLDSFLLVKNTSAEQQEIIKTIVMWNGYFTGAVSLVIQVLSYIGIGERIGRARYLIIVPLMVAVAAVVALTPLFVMVVGFVLVVTGFTDVLYPQRHNTLQQAAVVLYQAFYSPVARQGAGYALLAWFCRAMAGLVAGAAAAVAVDYPAGRASGARRALVRLLLGGGLGLFMAAPSLVAQLASLGALPCSYAAACAAAVLSVNLAPLVRLDGFAAKALFAAAYGGLVVAALLSGRYSESFTLLLSMCLLALCPQACFVPGFLAGAALLLALGGVRYAAVAVSYQSTISTFALMAVLFLCRYRMVKHSAIRRIAQRMRVQNVGCKVNHMAFEVGEEEVDVFLALGEDQARPRQDATVVYDSLRWQMLAFVHCSCLALFLWNFYPLTAVVMCMATLLIPTDQRDDSGNIKQIAGYIGILEGWRVGPQNKQQMINNYAITLFTTLNVRIAMDSVAFAILYFTDMPGYRAGLTRCLADLAIWILQFVIAFIGLVYITGRPLGIFNKLVKLQRKKLAGVLSAISLFAAAFSTNQVLKLLPIFALCAIEVQASGGESVHEIQK